MLRKLILGVCGLAMVTASCGRQVTPDRVGNLGFIQFNFSTQGQLDFTNNVYVLAINQEGQQPEPFYADSIQNYRNEDFEIQVSNFGGSQPAVRIYPFVSQPGALNKSVRVYGEPLGYAAQDAVLTPDCNGQQTEFCLSINRALLAQPIPSGTTPTPSPSPCGSTLPSNNPSQSASPSPSPSASPCSRTLWAVNWFVRSPGPPGSQPIIDAPGQLGPQDTGTFNFAVDVSTSTVCYNGSSVSNCTWTAQGGWLTVTPSSAQVEGGAVVNNP